MIGKRLCGLPTIGEAPFSNALLFIGVFLDCSFVSFLKDSSKGIKTDTYYIDKQKLPYLYKDIIFDESDRKICVLDSVDFMRHSRGLLTKEGLGL